MDFGLLDPLDHGTRAAELAGDESWLSALVEAELALPGALVDAGLAPGWMTEVADELRETRYDLAAIAAEGRGGGNPVIPLVARLRKAADQVRAGASDHIHVGLTSQDVMDTASMLVARRVLDAVDRVMNTLDDALAALAEAHRHTPIVGRTLGQHASVTSFGLVVAGWLDGALQAGDLVRRAAQACPVQFGGSVGNLAVLTERARTRRPDADPAAVVEKVATAYADAVGLVAPDMPWHTNRLPVVSVTDALAAAVGAVGSFALDVTLLARTEIAEVAEVLGDGEGGSSAMPHKRNPVTAVLIVSAARQTPALLSTLHSGLLAEEQRPSGSWHAEWPALRRLMSLAVAATETAAGLVPRLEVDVERMGQNIEVSGGLAASERISAVLSDSLGAQAAFGLARRAAGEAVETRRPLRDVLVEQVRSAGHDEALLDRVREAFDPATSLGVSDRLIDRVLARRNGSRP